jgi:nucleotide-binding universal stress UspA family protein
VTILVGYPPNKKGKSVLGLAAMLARSSGENLVVCTVVPAPWLPGLVREDAAYQGYVDGMAESALAHARAKLLPDVSAEFVRVRARSAPSGLLEAAEQHQATVIVVGSSTAGHFGHITLSTVADRLLHSSPIPVALATRGFRTGDVDTVTRLTVAYTGTEGSDQLVRAARAVARRLGAATRLAAFAVQAAPPDTALFSTEAEGLVTEWTANIQAAAKGVLESDPEPGEAIPAGPQFVIVHGEDWEEVLEDVEWGDGDLLVIGSSDAGPVARVFLGSRAAKIVRHSPVPVLTFPREAAKALSQE